MPTSSTSTTLTYTSTTTATPTSCADIKNLHQVKLAPQPDSDIAGIGIIISFLASAGIVLLASLCSYRLGLIPDGLLNIADREFFGGRSTGSLRWRRAVEKGILVFSDQQIITGIAILIAGEWYPASMSRLREAAEVARCSAKVQCSNFVLSNTLGSLY